MYINAIKIRIQGAREQLSKSIQCDAILYKNVAQNTFWKVFIKVLGKVISKACHYEYFEI